MSHTTRLSFGPQVSITLKRDTQRRLIAMRTFVDESPEGYHLETSPDEKEGKFITLPRTTQFGEHYENGQMHSETLPGEDEAVVTIEYPAWIRRCVRQATAWARSTAINNAGQNFTDGEYHNAADTYRDVLDHFPPPPDAPILHWNYYLCVANLGHKEEAAEGLEMWFSEALQIAGLDVGPKVLGPARNILGEEAVRKHAEEWLPLSSPHDPAHKMTQRWLMRLGQGTPTRTRWEQHNSLPTHLKGMQLSVRSDGSILAAGGKDTDGYSSDTVMLWEPEKQAWRLMTALPIPLQKHSLVTLPGDAVMCIGGESHTKGSRLRHLKRVFLWTVEINEWEELPSLHLGRQDHSSIQLHDGRIMVIGGESPFGLDAHIEIWDRREVRWLKSTTTGTILKSPHLFAHNRKVFITGAGVTTLGSAVLIFDSVTNRLTPQEDLQGIGLDGLYPLSTGGIAIWAYSAGECNIGLWNPEKNTIDWNSSDISIPKRNDLCRISPCGGDHLLLLNMTEEGQTAARIIRPIKGLVDEIESIEGTERLEYLGIIQLPDGRVLVGDNTSTLILST